MRTKTVLPEPNFELLKPEDFISLRRDKNHFPTLNREIKDNFKPDRPWLTNDSHNQIHWNDHHSQVFRGLLAAYNEYYARIRTLSRQKNMDVRATAREMEKIFAGINRLQADSESQLQLQRMSTRSNKAEDRFQALRYEDWKKTIALYDLLFLTRRMNVAHDHLVLQQIAMAAYKEVQIIEGLDEKKQQYQKRRA